MLNISTSIGYAIEGQTPSNKSEFDWEVLTPEQASLIDEEDDHEFYRENFYNDNTAPHWTFATRFDANSETLPTLISIIKDDKASEYRTFTRTADVTTSWWRTLLGIGPANADLLRAVDPSLNASKFKFVVDRQDLREVYGNTEASPKYDEFVEFLGDKVTLQGWTKFRAGLDVKSDTTGVHSLYHSWKNKEIMWHVASMLPFNKKDKQQLERKRHIGNDICIVIFQDFDDEETIFKPQIISSRQIQVKLKDRPDETFYRVAVITRDCVPEFAPKVPEGAIFKKSEEFKDYLYTKLINGEKAAHRVSLLRDKLVRTKAALLQDVIDTYCV